MNNSMTRAQKIAALLQLVSMLVADESIPLPYEMGDGTMLLFCHTKAQWEATTRALGNGTDSEGDDALIFFPELIPFMKVYGFKSGVCTVPAPEAAQDEVFF